MGVWVLRYGHRKVRDARASTHVALTARAFGARGVIFEGEEDKELIERINKVVKEWGGEFEAKYAKDWIAEAERFKKAGGCFVHLTMYGLPIQKCINEIKESKKDCLVLVGSQKVPKEAYELADFNVAVGNQPHSEIAALAVFLDRYFEGKELELEFKGARRKIKPMKIGKNVILCLNDR
jgi:tRNA (cytidine56-2'-O)-methyltransferase